MNIPNKLSISKMPRDIAKQRIPYIVLKLLNGAEVIFSYENKRDVVCVKFDSTGEYLHIDDFKICKKISDKIYKEWILSNNLSTSYGTLKNSIDIHRMALKEVSKVYDDIWNDKKHIIFIKGDNEGCGYWRMVIPARHINDKKYVIDVSAIEVMYEYLLEYDIIVVQRICDWNSYYILERLKKIGKKIVYDIDDNLFELPEFHPSARHYNNDARESASAIMNLADSIIVTTERLKKAFCRFVGEHLENKIFIIPNSINISDYNTTYKIYDKCFRILWCGGASHEHDLLMCANQLGDFLSKHSDAKFTIIGYMPKFVINNFEFWKDKIEYIEFRDTDTYFSMLNRLQADVAICPLIANGFNECKSVIKWVEYSMASLLVFASNVAPYSDVLVNGLDSVLVGENEWCELLEEKYNNRYDDKWKKMIEESRKKISERYDIVKNIVLWEKIFDK